MPATPSIPAIPAMCWRKAAVRQMTWGFPLALKGKSGQLLKPKPVNNARADKLDGFMWRYSFQDRRCLIPVTEFCEAEGEKGRQDPHLVLPSRRGFVRRRRHLARHRRMGPGLFDGHDRSVHPCSGRPRPDAGHPAARPLGRLAGRPAQTPPASSAPPTPPTWSSAARRSRGSSDRRIAAKASAPP